MLLSFHKYQGTGNDFVILDNREKTFPTEDIALVAKLCDRRFGIGADGLILLENHVSADFKMVYYNSDGRLSSMCGNGGRCIVHFANRIGVIDRSTSFEAIDGMHTASISGDLVDLAMSDVTDIEMNGRHGFMDTGSPHYMVWREGIDQLDLIDEAHKIRYGERFKEEGTNVNFLQWSDEGVYMRTYERGVEGETLSCGTGMVAAALFASVSGKLGEHESCAIYTRGGQAEVEFQKSGERAFEQIRLIGPAVHVFSGEMDV